MKKILLSVLIAGVAGSLHAQEAVTDTVVTGPQYASQVWYSLPSGEKTDVAKSDWDIALSSNSFSVSILINDGAGTHLWKYPDGDVTAWNTVDTTGMGSWTASFNSETDWETGAFNDHASGSTNYGWGDYDMGTHNVIGSAIFIIQLSDKSFKKIIIEKMTTSGDFSFKYADLDGSNEKNVTLVKSDYANKNYAYYSLLKDKELNPEPESGNWDLLFTQYTTQIPMEGGATMPYVVTGVLSNINVLVAKVEEVDAKSYTDYESHKLDSAKNAIGYNWKSYDMDNSAYKVVDSTVFFVQDRNEDIWKLIFTGFGGSENGDYIFSKEKLSTSSIQDAKGSAIGSFAVYPNPVSSGNITIAYSLKESQSHVNIVIYDNVGRVKINEKVSAQSGMNLQTISTESWTKGVYILNVEVAGNKTTQKIIVL